MRASPAVFPPAHHSKRVELEAVLALRLSEGRRRGYASSDHAAAVQILRALGRCGEADALIETLAAMPLGSAEDIEALGFVAFEAGNYMRSRDWYAKVVDARPGDALAWFNLATGERNVGKLEAAVRACANALRLAPTMVDAVLLRSQLRTQSEGCNHISELRVMLDRAPIEARVSLHYALGKEYDDVGEYDDAFYHFDAGARTRRSLLQYDVMDDVGKLQRIMRSFNADRFLSAPELAPPHYGFIIGLPRSGTTMIERMLTGSSRARSNGETNNLFGALEEGAAASGRDVFERVANANPGIVYSSYAHRAGSPAAGAIVLEKLPFNYLYAGAIRLTIPNARTLLVRRVPADNLFAMYSTLFGSAYPFSYSLSDLATYYRAYQDLRGHWLNSVGAQLMEVAYEEVVARPLATGALIAAHMAVEWSDSMARIEQNTTVSATASAVQIRQPIYQKAVSRWKNYQRHLCPLTDALEKAGIDPFQ